MDLRVSSPCPKKWEDLAGDDRVRYCGDCRLNVYNLAEMSRPEVEALVRNSRGRLCGRLYLRGDRTATRRDCPGARSRMLLRRAATVAGVLLLVAFGCLFRSLPGPDRTALPFWVRDLVNMIDPSYEEPAPFEIVGIICPVNPPAPAPTAPPATGS